MRKHDTEFEICKKFAHHDGGEISVEGKEGEGATFHIVLPAK